MNRRTALCKALGAGLAALATAGCGQKGPLFLPEEKLEDLKRKRDAGQEKKTGAAPANPQRTAAG